MPLHARYIQHKDGGKLRTLVNFMRDDWLLYGKAKNPHTKEMVQLPIDEFDYLVGPNVLDSIIKKRNVWQLRERKTFFVEPEKRKEENKKRVNNDQYEINHPFEIGLCTAGKDQDEETDHFLKVEKRSSVSISTLVFNLATGIYGDSSTATMKISEIARQIWDSELERALKLYQYLAEEKKVEDKSLPLEMKPIATISQHVEAIVLKEACTFFNIDVSGEERRRGRPVTSENSFKSSEDSAAGKYIFLQMDKDNHLRGRLIRDYDGWVQKTELDKLTIEQLSELFIAFKRQNEDQDADLIETYLDLRNPQWKEVLIEAGEKEYQYSKGLDDPYSILNIPSTATMKEIKKAYRDLMNIVHPDKHQDDNLTKGLTQLVLKAYEQIKNEHVN